MGPVSVESKPDRFVVGYAFPVVNGLEEGESSAYWLGKSFPDVPAEEYEKIGGGIDMIGVWAEYPDGLWYILGPPVEKVRYVPEQMRSVLLLGGLFAVLPVPAADNNQQLSENFRSAWYYGYHQWLPTSGYVADGARIAFEFYLSGQNSICIPVKLKAEALQTEPSPEEN